MFNNNFYYRRKEFRNGGFEVVYRNNSSQKKKKKTNTSTRKIFRQNIIEFSKGDILDMKNGISRTFIKLKHQTYSFSNLAGLSFYVINGRQLVKSNYLKKIKEKIYQYSPRILIVVNYEALSSGGRHFVDRISHNRVLVKISNKI